MDKCDSGNWIYKEEEQVKVGFKKRKFSITDSILESYKTQQTNQWESEIPFWKVFFAINKLITNQLKDTISSQNVKEKLELFWFASQEFRKCEICSIDFKLETAGDFWINFFKLKSPAFIKFP